MSRLEKVILINKLSGETPNDSINRFRSLSDIYKIKDSLSPIERYHLRMAYAGRLDPMASGLMVVLVGDECLKRDEYQNMDKEYEFELVFGLNTDTYDFLGLLNNFNFEYFKNIDIDSFLHVIKNKFTGEIIQTYPPYSSYSFKGKPLWKWSKEGLIDSLNIPAKKVRVMKLDFVSGYNKLLTDLVNEQLLILNKVKGDFRQDIISDKWISFVNKFPDLNLQIIKMRAFVSSGTYIRSLVSEIGKEFSVGAMVINIHRTKVGNYSLSESKVF